MTTLDQVPETQNYRHMLLIGNSKTGKSTFAAQAALDGYLVFYVDADNGISALKHTLRDSPEAQRRVIYCRTDSAYGFMYGLLTNGVFRWNMTQDKEFSSGMAADTDHVIQVIPIRFPKSMILTGDSWSSIALDAMGVGADRMKMSLEELSGNPMMQQVYGDASMKLTLLCAVLQHAKFHCIIQAHATVYEVYEKPKGSQEGVKQKHMRLLDIIKVPLSSSKPHGQVMAKYFNEIGWLEINTKNQVTLDFTQQYARIGGGTAARVDLIENMSFAKLFGPVPPTPEIDESWFWSGTAAEWKEKFQAKKPASTPTSAPPKEAGASTGVIAKKPANPMAAFMKKSG